MKERPILFSGPMVRAILEGRKTQTRRVVKPQPFAILTNGNPWTGEKGDIKCPYGQPGDRLWVRENFRESGNAQRADGKIPSGPSHGGCIIYAADEPWNGPWRPSIYMPRWASRITLEVVSVRVERLNEISSVDCFDEGISSVRDADFDRKHFPKYKTDLDLAEKFALKPPLGPSPQGVYKALWESINGPDSWALNPFVWVVEFKRPICQVCGTPGCIEMRSSNFHDGMRFGSAKCDYTGTPPFADAAWAGTNQDPEDPMCEWCAGTGHPYADESYGFCACPDLSENAPSALMADKEETFK